MSNKPVLRFNRRLRHVQGADDSADAPPSAHELQLESRRRELAEQRRELHKRADALAQREARVAEMEEELQDRLEELGGLLNSLHEEKAQMLESNEEEIVAFSLSITEKVLQHEIENGHYKMTEVVKSALRAVRDRGAIIVRVNPRDYEMTKSAVENLAGTYGRTRIKTVPDESIALASCCIETDSGKIFSEIPGRLEKIERSLLKSNGNSNGI